jgi:hypothetical protein
MKKLLVLLLLPVCGVCSGQNLDAAVTAATGYLSDRLPAASRVLLLKAGAPAEALSQYITQELSVRLVNGQKFTLTARNPEILRGINAETRYQMTGEVSDETAASIGKQLGAQAVIRGNFDQLGGVYRLSVTLADVETAKVLGQRTGNVRQDQVLTGLLAACCTCGFFAYSCKKSRSMGMLSEFSRYKYSCL